MFSAVAYFRWEIPTGLELCISAPGLVCVYRHSLTVIVSSYIRVEYISVVFFSQLLAALHAIVDMDLNFNQTPEITVLDMYNEYVWKDNTDRAKKDVLRSQSALGIVSSYMIGQMEISRVRSIAGRELGRDFTLEEFPYELLRQGKFPKNIYMFISLGKSAPQ